MLRNHNLGCCRSSMEQKMERTLTIGKKIGEGTYADIYEGQFVDYNSDTVQHVAVKKLLNTEERVARLEYKLQCAFYKEANERTVRPIAYFPFWSDNAHVIVMEKFKNTLYNALMDKRVDMRMTVDTALTNIRFYNKRRMFHRDCHLNNVTDEGRLFDFGMAIAPGIETPTDFYDDFVRFNDGADVNILLWSIYTHFPSLRTNTFSTIRDFIVGRIIPAINAVEARSLVMGTPVVVKKKKVGIYICSTRVMHKVEITRTEGKSRRRKIVRCKHVKAQISRHSMHWLANQKFPTWHGSLCPPPAPKKKKRARDSETTKAFQAKRRIILLT